MCLRCLALKGFMAKKKNELSADEANAKIAVALDNLNRLHSGRTLPSYLKDALIRYALFGKHPGSFLEAVLSNDLVKTFQNCNEPDLKHIHDLVRILFTWLPSGAHGSQRIFHAWIRSGGSTKRQD